MKLYLYQHMPTTQKDINYLNNQEANIIIMVVATTIIILLTTMVIHITTMHLITTEEVKVVHTTIMLLITTNHKEVTPITNLLKITILIFTTITGEALTLILTHLVTITTVEVVVSAFQEVLDKTMATTNS